VGLEGEGKECSHAKKGEGHEIIPSELFLQEQD